MMCVFVTVGSFCCVLGDVVVSDLKNNAGARNYALPIRCRAHGESGGESGRTGRWGHMGGEARRPPELAV